MNNMSVFLQLELFLFDLINIVYLLLCLLCYFFIVCGRYVGVFFFMWRLVYFDFLLIFFVVIIVDVR